MSTVYEVNPRALIDKCAEELKQISSIKPPEWSSFVKTGISKERPPVRLDWWYVRMAAIFRKIYMNGPIGVSKLRTAFGSKQNRGFAPERFKCAGGSHIRMILKQLEDEGFLKKADKGVHKGRILTPKGKVFLEKTAQTVLLEQKDKPKKTEKKQREEVEKISITKVVPKKDESRKKNKKKEDSSLEDDSQKEDKSKKGKKGAKKWMKTLWLIVLLNKKSLF